MKNLIKATVILSTVLLCVNCASDGGAAGADCANPKTGTYSTGGEISGYLGDVTVEADSTVTLKGTVNVCSGYTLTINEGVTVKSHLTEFSYLIVNKGAKINAIGSASKPIVFTSGKTAGSRARQDWGGIIINGEAQVNQAGATGEGNTGSYGGSTDTDNSGTMKYVRIEFAGKDFQSTDELNGLCLQGVGSGTTLEYLHFHNNNDDGVEMFGGNVSMKYIISTANGDDQVDATYGWRGTIQYLLAIPIEAKSTNDAGSKCGGGSPTSQKCGNRAIEFDNNSGTNTATPLGASVIANATLLSVDNGEDLARIREGAQTVGFYNSQFVKGYLSDGDDCIDVRDNAVVTAENNLFEGVGGSCELKDDGNGSFTTANNSNNNSPTNITTTNYDTLAELGALTTSSPIAYSSGITAGANTNLASVNVPTGGKALTDADYIGFYDGSTNWTNWTIYPEN